MLLTKKGKREAILKSKIEISCREAREYIDDLAAKIKLECANQPVENIRMTQERGECPCRAALRLIEGE